MQIFDRGKDGYILRVAAFHDSDFHRFRGTSFSGRADPGVETDILYQIPASLSMNGSHVILRDHAFGDHVSFYVVDVDNLLGHGANFVVDSFCESWYVDPDFKSQLPVLLPYKANLYSGLYIILRYHSVGTSAVDVLCNLYLHTKE